MRATMTTPDVHSVDVVSDYELGSVDPAAIASLVLAAHAKVASEVVVSFVDHATGAELNASYRGRSEPTNVLSFTDEVAVEGGRTLLGDVVICHPVAEREAREQGKTLEAHLTHLLVHGVLHLLGHDHEDDAEASRMEGLEVELLARLGVADPYRVRSC